MKFLSLTLPELRNAYDQVVAGDRQVIVQTSEIEYFEAFKDGGKITLKSGRNLYVKETPDFYAATLENMR